MALRLLKCISRKAFEIEVEVVPQVGAKAESWPVVARRLWAAALGVSASDAASTSATWARTAWVWGDRPAAPC